MANAEITVSPLPGPNGMREARYTAVAIALHWLIAAAIVGQILAGWWMGDAIDQARTLAAAGQTDEANALRRAAFETIQLHKATGITVLALSVLRLVWRLFNPPPPPPAGMPGWQVFAAGTTHLLFYVLMIGIPLSGWVMVSSSTFSNPTMWFGLFEIPKLPGFGTMAPEQRAAINDASDSAHGALAWVTVGLLVLHVVAALKHQFMDRDGVLGRMLPFLR
jgi:cytochrome b561